LRQIGALAAQQALEELGAKPTDEVTEELTRLKANLDEGQELLSKADSRLEKLEKIRAKLTGGEQGANIIEGVKDRLETISKALEITGTWTERLATIRTLQGQLKDERTALQALATLLELTTSVTDNVPVVGPTLGRFLGYYSKVAAACGEAVVRIQDKLIDENLDKLFGHPPAERHLYTLEEVTSNGALQNDNARQRIAKMLQVRRLLRLVNATSLADAQEMTR
jgi:hypothetical protein